MYIMQMKCYGVWSTISRLKYPPNDAVPVVPLEVLRSCFFLILKIDSRTEQQQCTLYDKYVACESNN